MIRGIQEAYYLQAKNPSDDEVLIRVAVDLGLDEVRFSEDLNHPDTQRTFDEEMEFGAAIGVQGFPSLILQTSEGYRYIPLDYNRPEVVLDTIKPLLSLD